MSIERSPESNDLAPQEVEERWRRPTLRDLALLVALTAVGLSLTRSMDEAETPRWVPIVIGMSLGVVLVGPIAIGAQWWFSGRRLTWSDGEVFGVIAAFLWGLPMLLALIVRSARGRPGLDLAVLFLLVPIQLFFGALGLVLFTKRLWSRPRGLAWTDLIGFIGLGLATVSTLLVLGSMGTDM